MGDEKTNGVFIALNLILLVLFLEFIPVVFDLGGRAFLGELLLLGVFMAVALVLMFSLYHNIKWSFLGLLIFFAANLINTLFLYFSYQFKLTTAIVLAGLGLLGLIISVIKINHVKGKELQLTLEDDFDRPVPEDVKIIPEEEFDIVKEEVENKTTPKTAKKPKKPTKKTTSKKKVTKKSKPKKRI